jgi:hypothetical protein
MAGGNKEANSDTVELKYHDEANATTRINSVDISSAIGSSITNKIYQLLIKVLQQNHSASRHLNSL